MTRLTSEENAPPNMCYHAEFDRSALNGVGINTGEPPEIGELWNSSLLGWEAWLAARYTPSPHVLQVFTTSNFVVWQQKVYA